MNDENRANLNEIRELKKENLSLKNQVNNFLLKEDTDIKIRDEL